MSRLPGKPEAVHYEKNQIGRNRNPKAQLLTQPAGTEFGGSYRLARCRSLAASAEKMRILRRASPRIVVNGLPNV